MPTDEILALLTTERDKLNRAIEALQGPTKRMGRPPKNSVSVAATTDMASKPKRKFSAATRRKMAAAQRLRWAAIKGEAETVPTPVAESAPVKKGQKGREGKPQGRKL